MIIYKITNIKNNKSYIGQTTQSLTDRFKQHCRPSSTYCRRLHKAIKKYGKNNFKAEIIFTAKSLTELNSKEEEMIKIFNTLTPDGYNLLPGGFNKKHNEETKLKMSKSRTGKKVPKLSRPRGPMPEELKIKISKAKKGRPNGLLGKKRPGIKKPNARKKIKGIDSFGNKIIFNSIKEASLFFNKSHTNLVAHLKGRKLSWCGYKWCYLRSKK